MNDRNDNGNPSESPEAPDRLVADLRAAFGAPVDVPLDVNFAVLTCAHRRFARRKRRILVLRWGGVAAGVAACALLCLHAWLSSGPVAGRCMSAPQPAAVADAPEERPAIPPLTPSPVLAEGRATQREDYDHNGRVDILDAFALARDIESGSTTGDWDLSGDGAVDRADVDLIAMAAVDLGKGRTR